MNECRNRRPIAMQLCSIVLLISFVAASARSQAPATATSNDDPSDTTGAPSFASRFTPSFVPPGLRLIPANGNRTNIDQRMIREFDKAWSASGNGTNGREGVVLIFRMEDGNYTGRSQGFTNQREKFTFKWNPEALAIVHTHPNNSDPRPSEQDKRVADKYSVPNFTITTSGMYVYDPATKKTTKVLKGLDWLKLSTYEQMSSRDGSERRQLLPSVLESGFEQNPAAFAASNVNKSPPLSHATHSKE